MKILLQNLHTKLYFSLLGAWTSNPKAAYDFRHSERALDFAHRTELTYFQVVVEFLDPAWNKVVPCPVPIATLSRQARG